MSLKRRSRKRRWLEGRRCSPLYLALLKLAQIPRLENNKYGDTLRVGLESVTGKKLWEEVVGRMEMQSDTSALLKHRYLVKMSLENNK